MVMPHSGHETKSPQLSSAWVERLSEHLRDEESTIAGVLDAVRNLHQSLRHLKGDELGQSLENEAAALIAAQSVQQRRKQIRGELASLLGISPERLTLEVIASAAGQPLCDVVRQSRGRLAELLSETNRLNRQNAAMIQQSLSLIRMVVGHLTRTAGMGQSYNAGGAREEVHVGSLMEWGG